MKALLTIAVLALGIYFLYVKSTQAGGNEMTVTELKSAIEAGENMLVLDVRTVEEWNEGHIKGAKLIPVGELQQRLDELKNYRDTKIAVICRSGGRSARASQLLTGEGFSNIHNVVGGMNDWHSKGYPAE